MVHCCKKTRCHSILGVRYMAFSGCVGLKRYFKLKLETFLKQSDLKAQNVWKRKGCIWSGESFISS